MKRTTGHEDRVVKLPPPFTQRELVALADHWEPEASSSPPGFRLARCVICGHRMIRMWHLWVHDGGYKKEVHCCRYCGKARHFAPLLSDEMPDGWRRPPIDQPFPKKRRIHGGEPYL
jgi:hypothetical protein